MLGVLIDVVEGGLSAPNMIFMYNNNVVDVMTSAMVVLPVDYLYHLYYYLFSLFAKWSEFPPTPCSVRLWRVEMVTTLLTTL
jgi:hypothetical protein